LAEEFTKLGYPGKLHSIKCDVSNENEVEDMFKWIKENVGGVDICVNNAAFSYKESLLGIKFNLKQLRQDKIIKRNGQN
jgi:NAD(P)-dependent dehydrogenase (short-subunit alcohol dehydrogenase family)